MPVAVQERSAPPVDAVDERLPAGRLAVGAPADILLFAEQASTLAGEQWFSKGQNCPFLGHCLPGRVRYTLLDGRISYQA